MPILLAGTLVDRRFELTPAERRTLLRAADIMERLADC
jgi:hypothetical protein